MRVQSLHFEIRRLAERDETTIFLNNLKTQSASSLLLEVRFPSTPPLVLSETSPSPISTLALNRVVF